MSNSTLKHLNNNNNNNNKWSRNFDKKHITGSVDFFHRVKFIWHQPVGSHAVGCSSHADAVIDFFAAYTAAVTYNAFQKLPPPLWDSVISQENGWEERLWNDVFCVGWDTRSKKSKAKKAKIKRVKTW